MNAVTKLKPPTEAEEGGGGSRAVYGVIAKVQAEIAKEGISKDRNNQQQKYKFRGIDDVYNALAPILAKHELCILPRMLSREVVERKSNGGGALFYVTVEAEFDFIAAVDGSCHVVRTFGEAMDSGDKATNKAMSAAYKYAAFMAFAIPTEGDHGDNDADATTHEVALRSEEPTGMPDAEWSRLVQLLEATKADTNAMLKHYGVKNLRHLNQDQYANAVEVLNVKLAKMAKEETDAKAKAAPAPTNASGFGEILEDEIPY